MPRQHKESNVVKTTENQDEIEYTEFDTDFSDVDESATSDVLPQGIYTASVTAVEVRQGAKGPYLNFEFSILDDPFAGRKVWDIASFAPTAKAITLKTLTVIVGHAIPRAPFRLADYEDEIVGKVVRLRIAPRDYDGQQQNDVKAILPAGAGGFESAATRKRGKAGAALFE